MFDSLSDTKNTTVSSSSLFYCSLLVVLWAVRMTFLNHNITILGVFRFIQIEINTSLKYFGLAFTLKDVATVYFGTISGGRSLIHPQRKMKTELN